MKRNSRKIVAIIIAACILAAVILILWLSRSKASASWQFALSRDNVDVASTGNPNYFRLIKLSHYKDDVSVALFNPTSRSIEIYSAEGKLLQSKFLTYAEDEAITGMVYFQSKDGFLLLKVNHKSLEQAFDKNQDESGNPQDTFEFLFVRMNNGAPVLISFDKGSRLSFTPSLQFLDMKILADESIQFGKGKHKLDLDKRYISFIGENDSFNISKQTNTDSNVSNFQQSSPKKDFETKISEYVNRCTPINIGDLYLTCIDKSTNRESLLKGADMYEFWTMRKEGQLGKYRDKVFDVDVWDSSGYILKLDNNTKSWVIEKVLI